MFFLTLDGKHITAAGLTWCALHSCTFRYCGATTFVVHGSNSLVAPITVTPRMTIEDVAWKLRVMGAIT